MATLIKKRRKGGLTIADIERLRGRGITEVGKLKPDEAVEEYINRSPYPLELKAYLPFSSDQEALVEMDAIYKSFVTDKLIKFLLDYFPSPTNSYSIGISDPHMSHEIVTKTGLGCRCSVMFSNVMRHLREKIDQLIFLQPGELEKAQINLARLHINQMDTKSAVVVSPSSPCIQELLGVSVVPHKFEGLFSVRGEEDLLCTRNLVPGEALHGEKLVHVHNEDITEIEYRVWDPLRSKLAAAIHHGITNIWIKPGSRVLYIGNVCGLTVSDLSDLVGLEGMVYVAGLSTDVADMAGKRPNVLTINTKWAKHSCYRMLVGMVDVLFAEIDHHPEQQFSEEGCFLVNNARHYLRAAGHYMISRQVNVMDSRRNFIFAADDYKKQFKPIETVVMDMMEGAFALDVGGYRMPKEQSISSWMLES